LAAGHNARLANGSALRRQGRRPQARIWDLD
jgi:hypothetical protein